MQKTMLIVDDEKEIREIIAETFPDFQIFQAKNGAEGYKLAIEHKPDIILSDVRMPEMSGLEMVQKLRKEKLFCSVVFISGYSDPIKKDEAAMIGAFDFLDKPIKPAKLQSVVRSALMLGKKVIATLASDKEMSLVDDRQYIDLLIPNVPSSLINRLQLHCSKMDINMEKTIIDWITERLDKSQ